MEWDKYFMSLVSLVAMKSKDQKSNHGAVIVGVDNEIKSTGYNSFIRGLDDNVKERQERPEKYYWMEHAERNAIYNAALNGISLKNSRMYISGLPCTDCIRAIIQCGIKKIIVFRRWNDIESEKWIEDSIRTLQMIKETGIELEYYDDDIIYELYFKFNNENIK